MVLDGLQHAVGTGVFQKPGRGAKAHGKQHQSTEPECEGERRRSCNDIVRHEFSDITRKTFTARHDIPVEMHGALGRPGRAGCEGDERDVVGRSFDILEIGSLAGGSGLQGRGGLTCSRDRVIEQMLENRRLRFCGLHLLGEGDIAEGVGDLRLLEDIDQLAGPQQWHGCDTDATGLQDTEPACHHHRRVGRT